MDDDTMIKNGGGDTGRFNSLILAKRIKNEKELRPNIVYILYRDYSNVQEDKTDLKICALTL